MTSTRGASPSTIGDGLLGQGKDAAIKENNSPPHTPISTFNPYHLSLANVVAVDFRVQLTQFIPRVIQGFML